MQTYILLHFENSCFKILGSLLNLDKNLETTSLFARLDRIKLTTLMKLNFLLGFLRLFFLVASNISAFLNFTMKSLYRGVFVTLPNIYDGAF